MFVLDVPNATPIFKMVNKSYQPKGRMCMQCKHRDKDCSHLDFKSMQVLGEYETGLVSFVKCSEYTKEEK